MKQRKLLLSLCDLTRDTLSSPFCVEWNGSTWDCATNGHAAILVRDHSWEERDTAPDVVKIMLGSLSEYENPIKVDGLLDYAFGNTTVCGACAGSGWVGDPNLVGGEAACGCDNGIPSVQHGSVSSIPFNRRLLYRYLLVGSAYAPTPSHEVLWRDENSPIFVRDAAVRIMIAVMPVRFGDNPIPVEELQQKK